MNKDDFGSSIGWSVWKEDIIWTIHFEYMHIPPPPHLAQLA